ncbi:type II toxin-antitoxin system Phd/YefM family antitoxin [Ralstonia pseudosolanacearum]|uniref:type II toxin-antitoxin system Phd/YefM family antitoxin n=1 Tax=Ralstonia pseudosolanacearum TaxID=1310165 RepID=UPI0018D056FC|nr:type II toxin-antitoxin system Phd/YefM family antitoxin [Ralstonia pseudosolanacearum]
MQTVNIHEAKTHLSKLIEAAAEGEDIVIAKAGKPLVRMIPFAPPKPMRRLGGLKGKIRIAEDFDAPLPGDLMAAFEGR